MLCLAHQPLHVVPRRDVQPLFCFEELLQLFIFQQIPRITDKDAFEIQDQISQCPFVSHVPRSKEDTHRVPFGVTYAVQI